MLIKERLLWDLITSRIALGPRKPNGWHQVRCNVCNDYQERGGFKLDGDEVRWKCFNCGSRFKFTEHSGKLYSDAKQVLYAFGITSTELDEVLGSSFFARGEGRTEISEETLKPKVSLFTPEIDLPPKSYPLGSAGNDALQNPLIEYMFSRKLDPLKLQTHYSLDPKYLGRIIIPCFRDSKVIFWQARTIFKDEQPRYRSPSVVKEAVLWGYDNIWKSYNQPLFITEGIFDAFHLDGVALLGSELTAAKLEVLNKTKRRKVVVVDRNNNGKMLAEVALKNGWEITFPPEGTSDTNDSVCKHGLIYTMWTLMRGITVPKGVKDVDGLTVQSKLQLNMQVALANLGKRK
jgi:hypothetical protein